MQIQLDHIYKKLNNLFKIALFLGLLMSLSSCDSDNFIINDVEYDIINYYEYSLVDDRAELKLKYNYPKLSLGVKLENEDVNLKDMSITDLDNSLNWHFTPKLISLSNSNYYGYDNINLSSYDFSNNKYSINLLNDKGKEINTKISINNPFNKKINDYYIYYYLDKVIISDKSNKDYKKFQFNSILLDSKKIEVKYYDFSNKLTKSSNIDNYFLKDSYPFMIKIDNYNEVKYLELDFIDKSNIKNCIKIDLSSSDSFF